MIETGLRLVDPTLRPLSLTGWKRDKVEPEAGWRDMVVILPLIGSSFIVMQKVRLKKQRHGCVSSYAERLQHYLNPLHVYCRLRELGMRKGSAIFLCRIYERAIFKPVLVWSEEKTKE